VYWVAKIHPMYIGLQSNITLTTYQKVVYISVPEIHSYRLFDVIRCLKVTLRSKVIS
jgi:hypothetical protein